MVLPHPHLNIAVWECWRLWTPFSCDLFSQC